MQRIDHQPALVEAQILQRQAERPADAAVGAVAADQEIPGHRLGSAAVEIEDVDLDPVAGVAETLDRPAEQHGHGLAPGQRLAQQALHLRLDEGEGRRPAEVPGRRQRIEQLDDPVVDAAEVGAGMGPDALGEFLRHAAELEDAHALPIEGDGARLVVNRPVLLGDADASAPAPPAGCASAAPTGPQPAMTTS